MQLLQRLLIIYNFLAGGLRVLFGISEGIVTSVLKSDDSVTKLLLLVPQDVGALSGFSSSLSVNIISTWSSPMCIQCPSSVNFSTDGQILRLYQRVVSISASPSKVEN
jgi:hypothetical protein